MFYEEILAPLKPVQPFVCISAIYPRTMRVDLEWIELHFVSRAIGLCDGLNQSCHSPHGGKSDRHFGSMVVERLLHPSWYGDGNSPQPTPIQVLGV